MDPYQRRYGGNLFVKSHRRIKDLLDFSDRGVGSSSGIAGVLSRLFQNILKDLDVKGVRWKYLLDRYVDREVAQFDNRRDRTSIRGNLNKELTRKRMSWKVFCKAMMFLDFVSFEIQIHAKHRDGTVTVHKTTVDYTTKDEPNLGIVDPETIEGPIQLSELAGDDLVQVAVQHRDGTLTNHEAKTYAIKEDKPVNAYDGPLAAAMRIRTKRRDLQEIVNQTLEDVNKQNNLMRRLSQTPSPVEALTEDKSVRGENE